MINKILLIIKRNTIRQRGAVLILALILFALGALLIVPLLSFMGSGFKTTDQVYDQKAYELYAADAGVRDALWYLKYDYYSVPQKDTEPPFAITLDDINRKSVNSFVSFIAKRFDALDQCTVIYKIDSTAKGLDGKGTQISSYVILPFELNNMVFEYAIASDGDMEFSNPPANEENTINGRIAYTGDLTAGDTSDPTNDYVVYNGNEPLPDSDPNMEFPSTEEYLAYANGFKTKALNGGIHTGDLTISSGNLGPIYIDGNLTIDGNVTLLGAVYVTGNFSTTNDDVTITLNGSEGAIVVDNNDSIVHSTNIDIDIAKSLNLSAPDPEAKLILMTVHGNIDFRKDGTVFQGIAYAPEGWINLKKDAQITGSLVAGDGFSADKGLSIEYVDYFSESILPGWVPKSPQLQTWDISGNFGIGIIPSTLPSCKVNSNYPSQTLIAFGGTTPYSWALTSGSLPNGLTLIDDIVSGTPTTIGTFDFTITVTDDTGKTGSKNYSMIITSLDITTSSPLPNGQVGSSYSQTLNATGGTPTYSFTKVAGTLPPGLNFSTDGVISGTPTTSKVSPYIFTIRVTDSATPTPATVTQAFSITITGLSITNPSLPEGTVGVAYNQTLLQPAGQLLIPGQYHPGVYQPGQR